MKIKEVATQTGLSVHTLRYYEQIGLVRPVSRAGNGHRAYSVDDVYRINFVTHLRSAGMPIAQIKRYAELAERGEATTSERLRLLEAHERAVTLRIEKLHEHLQVISKKVKHYRESNKKRLRGKT